MVRSCLLLALVLAALAALLIVPIDPEPAATSSIAGVVVDDLGAPAANIAVWLHGETAALQARTDAQGKFWFAVVAGESGFVSIPHVSDEDGQPIFTIANAGQTNIKLVLPAPEAGGNGG